MRTIRMTDRWDNIEILQAIDRMQLEVYRGGPLRSVRGLYLMERDHRIGAAPRVLRR
jgi:hypothetical protein